MQPASLNQLVTFFFRPEGRIGRLEYGLGVAFIYALMLAMLAFVLARDAVEGGAALAFFAAGIVLTIVMAMLVVKRCHDFGLSGAFVLLLFIPVIGLVFLVALFFIPGSAGPNLYGLQPQFRRE